MKKKKILLLSDDLRMHSGIATVSKDIVLETMHQYDWVQVGGAIKHPEEGKMMDLSQSIRDEFNIPNAYLRIYPTSGYGSSDLIRQLLEIEKPDFWSDKLNAEKKIKSKKKLDELINTFNYTIKETQELADLCLLYTSPSPRD